MKKLIRKQNRPKQTADENFRQILELHESLYQVLTTLTPSQQKYNISKY